MLTLDKAVRHYPTDLIIALDRAREFLPALPRSIELSEALDRLFGGLSQYPWQFNIDGNDVFLWNPLGTVTLDDHKPESTLRGLIMAWATGNDVRIRTRRPAYWNGLLARLRSSGVPLPGCRVSTIDDSSEHGPVLTVPSAEDGGLPADCDSDWARGLMTRTRLRGTTLAAARAEDDEINGRARLDAKLRYLAHRAKDVPYYRELAAAGGLDDLAKLPILDKAALEANSLPSSRAMCSSVPPSGEVLRSGASSGNPRYIVYSRTDWMNMVREAIPMLYSMGLSSGDRLINTLYGGGLYGGMLTTASELSRMPIECYTTGQFITVDDLLMLCDRFAANSILGMPALILPLLRDAKAKRPGLILEKVIYGGTPMAESDKDWLRRNLGTRVISSVLAANDGAQLGYQCGSMSGTLHHLCEDYNLIEAVDEAGRPVPEGEAGDLLITSLQKFEGPLIRYKIGDHGRVFRLDCACGVSGPVLDYRGRSDGLIRVKGLTLLYGEVFEALARFEVSQLQIEVATRDNKETVTVRTESALSLDSAAVRAYLAEKFEALGDATEYDAALDVFEFSVECHAEGRLGRNPVSGKIKPIIDARLGAL